MVGVDDAAKVEALRQSGQLLTDLRHTDDRLDVVDWTQVVEPAAARRRAQRLDEGQLALRQAELARKADGIDDAKRHYESARNALQESDWRQGFDSYVEALAWSALLGRVSEDMLLVFTLRPEWQFPKQVLTTQAETWLAEQRQSKEKASRITFDVASTTPALVWIDGVYRGLTPVRVENVVAGRHLITAMAPGFALVQHEELVTAGGSVALKLEDTALGPDFRAALESVRGGFRSGQVTQPIKALIELCKVQEGLVAGIVLQDQNVTVVTVRMNRNGLSSSASRKISSARGAATEVMPLVTSLYDQPLGLALNDQGAPPVGVSKRGGSYIAFAGASAFLVTGLILTIVAQSKFADAQKIPQVETVRYDQAIAEGQAVAVPGYIAFGLAAGGTALGIWLFATSAETSLPAATPTAPAEHKDPFAQESLPLTVPSSGCGVPQLPLLQSGHRCWDYQAPDECKPRGESRPQALALVPEPPPQQPCRRR